MSTPESQGPGRRPSAGWADSLGRLGRLARKELSEILRDRRTIITLVLMPLLLYPLLSIAFQQFSLAGALQPKARMEYRLGFRTEQEGRLVHRQLELGDRALTSRAGEASPDRAPGILRVQEFLTDDDDLLQPLKAGAVDLSIRVPNADRIDANPQTGVALVCELHYVEGSATSKEALDYVERRIAAANNACLARRLAVPAKRPAVLIWTRRAPVSEAEGTSSLSLPALVPLILILMTITGAVYPAIDLTAGERERGTLEILVAAPVPRLGLLFAKYVSVFTVAVLTALVNLVAMTATLMLSNLGPLVFGDAGLTFPLVVEIFALLLLFAAFFSAVLLALTSLARTFKEAQAYLIPLMLVSLAPGVIGIMPGLKLAGLLSVVPLLNVVLLARDLFGGAADPAMAAVVVVSTLLYALAALAGAACIFGAEGVLYSEQSGWSDLFRRPHQSRATATVSSALFCYALLFPAYFVVTSLLAQVDAAARPVMNGLATVVLFGVVPFVAAVRGRVRLRSGFQWQPAAPGSLGGAAILGVSLFPLIQKLLGLLQDGGLTLLGPDVEAQIQAMLSAWQSLPPAVVVMAYGVVPAVFEELFFRGYLFAALRVRTGPGATIFGSAVLFGLLHGAYLLDRVLPSTILGIILGWVCWRTRSVLPGMMLHVAYNTLWILGAYYEWQLAEMWLTGTAVLAGGGAALVQLSGRRAAPKNGSDIRGTTPAVEVWQRVEH